MARSGYEDPYEREMRDRRVPILREQERRDRNDLRDQRQTDNREQDRIEYIRDSRLDQRPPRDNAARPVYDYADQDDRENESPPRGGYMDDPRERHRHPVDLRSGRREDPGSRYQEYFLPGEEINREVIQYDICRYLGNDATVRPYTHTDGRQGYLIKAYRAPTTAMITTLKQDSKRFEVESAQRRRQFGQLGVSYSSSTTFDDRQRQGRPDVRPEVTQSRYAGCNLDTTMDDYDDRGPPRNYRDQEPRITIKEDPRKQLPMNRHGLHFSQGYTPGLAYPSSHQTQPISSGFNNPPSPQSMTLGRNNTPGSHSGTRAPHVYHGDYSSLIPEIYHNPTPAASRESRSAYYDIDEDKRIHPAVGYPSSTPPPSAPPSLTIGRPLPTPAASREYRSAHDDIDKDKRIQPAVGYSSSTPTPSAPPSLNIGPPPATPHAGYQAGAQHPGWGDTPNFKK